MAMDDRDWRMIGLGLLVGFFAFSVFGRSLVKSAYKLTESEVKKLERKARERVKKEEQKMKALG